MKTMKKLMVLVLSIMMVLGTTVVTSFAAKNDKITVTGTKVGETLKIYKMMDLVVNNEEEPTAYKYTIADGWTDFFTTGYGKDYVTIDATDGHVTWKDGMNTEAKMILLGQEAAKVAANPIATKVAEGTSVEFTGLPDGYFLITSSLGTKAIIETTPDKNAVTIGEKNPDDNITKQVKEDSTSTFGATNDAQIGDTVDFQSVITLNPYTRNVSVVDTMDAGLAYTTGSVAIAGLTKGTDYTVEAEAATGFTIKFTDTYLKSLESKTAATDLTMTYSATLGVAAVSATPALVDQKNTVTLKYGDKQEKEAETTTTTHYFGVHKYEKGKKNANLAGAVFQLKKNGTVVKLTKINDTNYKVDPNGSESTFTTVATGDIVIWGVDADSDYTLTETQEPSGFNKLAGDVEVTVKADNTTVVEIENETGTELPSTGGMGTTILYIVGGLLVVGCGIMLVAKKKADK